jgi:hypothetical protein
MAQTGFTPIRLYSSTTAASVPSASNISNSAEGSEIAINVADGKLFYKDGSNVVQVIATKDAAAGTFTTATIISSAPRLFFTDTNGLDFSIFVESNTWYVLNDTGGNAIAVDQSGNLTATGNVTAFSDERLKSDIKTIPAALDTVDQLRGVSFIKDGKANIGVIAQEVQRVLPQVVQENADGYLSVAYGNLVGVLIEAVKELRAEVKALKGQ